MKEDLYIASIKELLKRDLNKFFPSLVSLFIKKKSLKTKNLLLLEQINLSVETTEKEIDNFLLEKNLVFDLYLIEKLFENSLQMEFRKTNGVFYTPLSVVKFIVNSLPIDSKSKICDMSCGCGVFLIEATRKLYESNKDSDMIKIIEKNIFGYDISDDALLNCKLLLTLLALTYGFDKKKINFKLERRNSLSLIDSKKKFSHIIGNPPYIRSKFIDKESRNLIKNKFPMSNVGNTDIYLTFIELAFKLLKKNGTIGFIIPNSYFNTIYGKELRKFLKEERFLSKVLDFKSYQVFNDCLTYTCISIFNNKRNEVVEYSVLNNLKELDKPILNKINYDNLSEEKFLFFDDITKNNILKIENAGIKLEELNINTGIATLKNKLYLLDNNLKQGDYYVKIINDKEYLIEKEVVVEVIKINKIKNSSDIKNNPLRIIYPYNDDQNPYSEKEIKKKFPRCYKYFLDIKEELLKRDKGKIKKENWFLYGRTQNIKLNNKFKILIPSIAKKPNFVICNKTGILFCEGYTLEPNKFNKKVLLKILNSKIMDYYIRNTSRNYSCNYYGYNKSFIKNFSIVDLTANERKYLMREEDQKKINSFLIKKYKLKI